MTWKKKTSPEEIWQTEFYQRHLASAAAYRAAYTREFFIENQAAILRMCESPLEGAFLAWWMAMSRHPHVEGKFTIFTQRDIEIRGNKYRLDFVVTPDPQGFTFQEIAGTPLEPKVCVELDGHDFHEKTKEQVEYRNVRDRDLQFDNWRVFHVSGSEFNRDPEACVSHVMEDIVIVFWDAYWKLKGRN
jgi:hypothetical protein